MLKLADKRIVLILCIIIISLGAACSKEDITGGFANTRWVSSDNVFVLEFIDKTLVIKDGNIKPDMDGKDFEKYENYKDLYEVGTYEKVRVEKDGDNIKVSNKDGLDLEFESISDDEVKDKEGNIFKKE